IIQNCEVTGIERIANKVVGVQTNCEPTAAEEVGLAVAGDSARLAERVGIRLPSQTHSLPPLVRGGCQALHPTQAIYSDAHVYVSQAHKGELVLGAGVVPYNGFGQRGGFHVIEEQLAAAVELYPIFARAHVLRTWGGNVDVTLDASPVVSKTEVDGLYVNCGWGTGGFKGTPAAGLTYARAIANDEPHPLNGPSALDRFETGHLIDEHGAAAVAH